MVKLVKCPLCGRMNSAGNVVCSNCGMGLGTKMEIKTPVEKNKKDLLELFPSTKPKQKFSWEVLKPSEMKLFLFLNLIFTSLFLQLVVKNRIIFSLFFYPSLYWFSCYWASKEKFDWQNFLSQFFLFLLLFFIVFSLL